jgi:hypothetical protein
MWIHLWAIGGLAGAHVGAPVDAVDVHQVETVGRVIEGSVGLAWTADGEDWRWVCHEAITTPDAVVLPRYAVAGRRWLATVPRLSEARTENDAVYWTDDGCSWSVASGLAGHEVPAIDLDPSGTLALAVTADEATGENAIWRSTDGGQSFEEVMSLRGHLFTSVLFADGATGTAAAGSVDAAGLGWAHWSTDAGVSWQSRQVIDGELVMMALHPAEARTGYFVVDGLGVETLYRTDDGGASAELLLDPEGFISDVEVGVSGELWVAFGGNAYLYAADGRTLDLVTEAPPGLGVSLATDRVMLATRFELVNDALAEGNIEEGFTPRFSFISFDGPLECAEGTPGHDVCAPLFPLLQESLGLVGDTGSPAGSGGGSGGADADDGGPSTDTSGSGADDRVDAAASKDAGCGGGAWVWLLPLGLIGLARPRRS